MCDEESLRPMSLDPHNRKLNRITIFRAGGDMNIISLWEGKGREVEQRSLRQHQHSICCGLNGTAENRIEFIYDVFSIQKFME